MQTRTKAGADRQIASVVELVQNTIPKKILGVYVYGSYTTGGLKAHSDIDLFVLLGSPTSVAEREVIIQNMLQLSAPDDDEKRRPVELIMCMRSELRPWHGSPHIDFHYGEWLRQDFVNGQRQPWSNPHPDIGIVITQVLNSGITLFGKSAAGFLDPLTPEQFRAILRTETDTMLSELEDDTRNVLLTLMRIWYSLSTGVVVSKQVAAEWTLPNVPNIYRPVLSNALAASKGDIDENGAAYKDQIRPAADFIVNKIKDIYIKDTN